LIPAWQPKAAESNTAIKPGKRFLTRHTGLPPLPFDRIKRGKKGKSSNSQ
jgi:hypothetical protein